MGSFWVAFLFPLRFGDTPLSGRVPAAGGKGEAGNAGPARLGAPDPCGGQPVMRYLVLHLFCRTGSGRRSSLLLCVIRRQMRVPS